MNPARYAHDYFYRNHSGKYVCFSFESKRRIKTKVIEFLKYNHTCEAKLSEYLASRFDLKLEKTHTSRKYIMYDIVDLDLSELKQRRQQQKKKKKISLWENQITTYSYLVLTRYNKNIRCNM